MEFDFFKIKRLLKHPVIKHLVLIFIFLLSYSILIIQNWDLLRNPLKGMGSESPFVLISVIFSILFLSLYIAILIFNAMQNKAMFILFSFFIVVLAVFSILVCVSQLKVESVEFDSEYIPFSELKYFSRTVYSQLIFIYLIPLLGSFLVFMDEVFSFESSKNRLYEVAFLFNTNKMLQNVFKQFVDFDVYVRKKRSKKDLLFLEQNDFSKYRHQGYKAELINLIKEERLADAVFSIQFAGYEISGGLKFCEIVGGDFYDIWMDEHGNPEIDNKAAHTLCLSLFDVAGHGIIASTYLPEIFRFLENRTDNYKHEKPNAIIKKFDQHLNDFNHVRNDSIFIPMTMCSINSFGEIVLSICGNPPPVLLNSGKPELMAFDTYEAPGSGSDDIQKLPDHTIHLKEDQLMIMGSDGVNVNFFKYSNAKDFNELVNCGDSISRLYFFLKKIRNNMLQEPTNRGSKKDDEILYNDDMAFFMIKKIRKEH